MKHLFVTSGGKRKDRWQLTPLLLRAGQSMPLCARAGVGGRVRKAWAGSMARGGDVMYITVFSKPYSLRCELIHTLDITLLYESKRSMYDHR